MTRKRETSMTFWIIDIITINCNTKSNNTNWIATMNDITLTKMNSSIHKKSSMSFTSVIQKNQSQNRNRSHESDHQKFDWKVHWTSSDSLNIVEGSLNTVENSLNMIMHVSFFETCEHAFLKKRILLRFWQFNWLCWKR